MNIVLAGILPPANLAPELFAYVEKDCPALVTRMQTAVIETTFLEPAELGCTPLEWIQLRQAGYEQQPGQTFGANKALRVAEVKDGLDPVYVAELTSVNIGRDRMSMIQPSLLDVTQAECDELFESVSMLWDGTGLSALPINARQWRVWLPEPAVMDSITPAAASNYNITDWWPQDPSLKNWRKLVNEIQMVWHDHPVNERRAELGQPPINSVWLFGGAIPRATTSASKEAIVADLGNATNGARTLRQSDQLIDILASAHATHEWAAWIAGLTELNRKIQSVPRDSTLNLLGYNRIITLTPSTPRWWHKVIRPRPTDWKSWWINQN